MLVVPTTEYGLTVPVVVGTNAIKLCKAVAENGAENIPTVWQNAFISLQQSHLGVVKSANKTDIQIQPMETVTLSGFVRKKTSVETAVTEQTNGASSRIGVCPRVVSLDKAEKSQRLPVRIYNMSAKVLTIKPKDNLCELHEVKILRNVDPVPRTENKANVNQQRVEEKEQ